MQNFKIKVTETKVLVAEIEANNEEEAIKLFEKDYFDNANSYDYLFNIEDTKIVITDKASDVPTVFAPIE